MRKREVVTIDIESRDKGKSFLLTEMSARDAEDWGAEMFMLAVNNGLAEGIGGGMADLVNLDFRTLGRIPFDQAKPLWDRMFRCVAFVPSLTDIDPLTEKPKSRPVVENPDYPDGDDIQEVGTRLKLRMEVFELHTGFSIAALLSILGRAAAQLTSSNTPISPKPSDALSEESTPA